MSASSRLSVRRERLVASAPGSIASEPDVEAPRARARSEDDRRHRRLDDHRADDGLSELE